MTIVNITLWYMWKLLREYILRIRITRKRIFVLFLSIGDDGKLNVIITQICKSIHYSVLFMFIQCHVSIIFKNLGKSL